MNKSPPAKSCAGVDVEQCEGELEIKNFAACCTHIKRLSNNKRNCREICSDDIMRAGPFSFGIVVVWSLSNDGKIDPSSQFGVYVKRIDDSTETASIALEEATVVNAMPSRSRTMREKVYNHVNPHQGRGWSPSFSEDPGEYSVMRLQDLLDVQKGWLIDGTLRVTCKVSVVTGSLTSSESSGSFKKSSGSSKWSAQNEVCEALGGLLASKELVDVTIFVCDEAIEVHSVILAARSPVFARMFASSMKEGIEKVVRISDLDPCAVRAMINYMYTGALPQEILDRDETALRLLEAAHRYEITTLVDRCTSTLGSRLSIETVSERLQLANLFNCKTFQAQCLTFIRENLPEVQTTPSFARLVALCPNLAMDIFAAICPPAAKRRRSADSKGASAGQGSVPAPGKAAD